MRPLDSQFIVSTFVTAMAIMIKRLVFLISAVVLPVCICFAHSGPELREDRAMHALVVGIGHYPESSGWNAVNGDRDVDLVVRMLVRNGFSQKDITVLVNGQATKAAIRDAFRGLLAVVAPGDVVYVHFSGHGQQVVDKDGDEEDGLDEAFVPVDAGRKYVKGVYEGENHILDDELNLWLAELKGAVGRAGRVMFVMDACHSGDSTRGEEEDEDAWPVRGTANIFGADAGDNPGMPVASEEERNDVDWIFLGACKSWQNNYEYPSEDGFYGRLTWALYSCMRPGMSFEELVDLLEKVYDGMPLPPGPPQNLDAFEPPANNGKLF